MIKFKQQKIWSGAGLAIRALLIFVALFQIGYYFMWEAHKVDMIKNQESYLEMISGSISGKKIVDDSWLTDDGIMLYRVIVWDNFKKSWYGQTQIFSNTMPYEVSMWYNNPNIGDIIVENPDEYISMWDKQLPNIENRRYLYYNGLWDVSPDEDPILTSKWLELLLSIPNVSRISYIEYNRAKKDINGNYDYDNLECAIDKSGYMIVLWGWWSGVLSLEDECY